MNRPSSVSDASESSSILADLTAEQQERLASLLDQFLSAMESGAPLDAEELAARHPDLKEPLRLYLSRLDELHQVSAGFANRTEPKSSDSSSDASEAGEGAEVAAWPTTTRRLGDFVLGDEIGRGGMGVVYEARQISLDRRVALKVLPFASILDSRTIARFKNEAKAAAQLQHPNIVPVYAIGSERGMHYYAMQLIEGRPLDQVLEQVRKRFAANDAKAARARASTLRESVESSAAVSPPAASSPGEAPRAAARPSALDRLASRDLARQEYYQTVMRLGMQAAEALGAAHAEGIVHRDVKPSNLLVDHDAKLWVTDFGLARIQSDAALSRTGDVVGTWRYMSPEQARGDAQLVDHRTDVYSLGVTLWELLALQPAYQDDDRAALLRQLDSDTLPSLAPHCPGLPKDLETVVLKAMSHVRDERYTTAEELAADLRRVLEGKRPLARPPSFVDRLSRLVRRHKRLAALGAAVLMFVTGVATVAAIATTRERLRAERNFARAERNFREARRIVDQFGKQLADRLAEIPGAESVRRELLRDTMAYYQKFVREARNDPQLKADIALTYSKIGSLASDYGAITEALDANRQAVRRLEEMRSAEPRSLEVRRDLAVAQRQLGDACRAAGELLDARKASNEAVRIDEQLVAEQPDDESLRADLAAAFDSLGQVRAAQGETKEAREHFADAIRLTRQLVAADPKHSEYRHQVAVYLNRLGIHLGPRQASEALVLHQEALKQLEIADPAQGATRPFRRELAKTYDLIGTAQARLQRWDEALAAHQQSIDLRQPMLDREPELTTVRRELAASLNSLGTVLVRIGRFAEAEEQFTKAIEVQSPLMSQTTTDLTELSSWAGMFNNRGFLLEQRQDFEGALKNYRRALELQREAYDRGRKVIQYRQLLSAHYVNLGRVLRQQGQFDEAVEMALARKKLWLGSASRLESVADDIRQTAQALAKADPQATAKVAEYEKLSADILSEAQAVRASEKAIVNDGAEADAAGSSDLSLQPEAAGLPRAAPITEAP